MFAPRNALIGGRSGLFTLHRGRGWSLRTRILVFSLLLLAPPVVLSLLLVYEDVLRAEMQVADGAIATTEVVAGTTDDFVASAERLLVAIAREDSLRRMDAAEANDYLAKLIPHVPNFVNLIVADRHGTPLARAIWEDPRLANDPDNLVLRESLSEENRVVSGRLTGRYLGQPAVVIAVPIVDVYGRRVGSLGGIVSLAALQRTLAGVRVGEHATITVVDSKGNMLVHPDVKLLYDPRDLKQVPPIAEVIGGSHGLVEYDDPSDGRRWLAAYTPIRQAPWGVVVSYPSSTAYVSVVEIAQRGLLYMAIAALVAIVLLAIESRTVTRPITALVQNARQVSERYSLVQAEERASDDLEQLSRTIQLLSTNLDENLSELSRSRQEMGTVSRRLRRAMARAGTLREEERARIARDVHDTAAQFVVAALAEVGRAEAGLAADPTAVLVGLQRAQALLRQSVAELESVIFELRPPSLGANGLVRELRDYLDRFGQLTGLQYTLGVEGEEQPLGEALSLAALRIVQESLHNVRKHAEVECAHVRLVLDCGRLTVSVSDAGRGFVQPADPARSSRYGLTGMDERATSVGGTLVIESSPGLGTTVRFSAPISPGRTEPRPQPARNRDMARGMAT